MLTSTNFLCTTDFLSDFLVTPLKSQTLENVLHHVIGVTIINAGVVAVPAAMDAMATPMLLTELSTVLLHIMWLMRTFQRADSAAYTGTTLAFVLIFFLTRVVLLPAYVLHVRAKLPLVWRRLGRFGRAGVLALVALQGYWFVQIVRKLGPVVLGRKVVA